MTVHAERLPSERTLLTVLDKEARETAAEAQRELAPIVAREVPRGRTGKLGLALRPKVSKTSTGQAVTVGVPRGKLHTGQATIADVVRWVNRGTGLLRTGGGPRAPIHSTRPFGRMTLPGGRKVWTVKGQAPNPFMARIRQVGDQRVQSTFARGATKAARAVEKVF